MRVGVIVRVDDRGLGFQTRDVARYLGRPGDAVVPLVVEMYGEKAQGYRQHPVFPDAPRVSCDGAGLDEMGTVVEWLRDVDAVFTAETFYDDRLVDEAERLGVATVCHVNPELYPPDRRPPSRVWLPTPWRAECFPGARLVPMPVAVSEAPAPGVADCPVIVHVVGRRAMADRNGTAVLQQSLRFVGEPCAVRVFTQEKRLPTIGRCGPRMVYEQIVNGVDDRWSMYAGAHILVMPRRYGGLSLPVQEAMASGLAVVMTDVEPNGWWPTVRAKVSPRKQMALTAAGMLPMVQAVPKDLGLAVHDLLADRDALGRQRTRSLEWAAAHSWESLRGMWWDELAEVIR